MSNKLIYINTPPKANTKADGSVFYTVLCGLSKGVTDFTIDTLTMEVYSNQLDMFNVEFAKCKALGLKLALSCTDVTVTTPKVSTYEDHITGELVTKIQASVWNDGPAELIAVQKGITVSAKLADLS